MIRMGAGAVQVAVPARPMTGRGGTGAVVQFTARDARVVAQGRKDLDAYFSNKATP